MTTLVGIKAEKGGKGVILASDLSGTQTRWTAEGDVAFRQQMRSEMQKIYVNNEREIALCTAGFHDQLYVNFLSKILEGKIDIRGVTKRGYFPQLKNLNEKRWDKKLPNSDYMNSLLIATRFDNPRLYTCWPLGKVEEREWTSIGSGSNYALNYISKQGKLIPRGLSLNEGIDLAVSGLDEAAQDIYTGGLDLVVVTKDGIREFGENIKRTLDSARERVVKRIKREYQSQ